MSNTPVVFHLEEDAQFAYDFAQKLHLKQGVVDFHRFPDGEISVQLQSRVKEADVYLVANLHHPNEKLIKLIFFAQTARANGANRLILIAPYLAYLRLDEIRTTGQGLTSRYFAKVISDYFDRIITIDPHLHRYRDLSQIYLISSLVVHAAPAIANWIWRHVENALIVGPDEESEQWIKQIAHQANLPYVIFKKKRYSDLEVSISAPLMKEYRERMPVMVDDIISTASTMIQGIKVLNSSGMQHPICVGVHAIFAEGALTRLEEAGAVQIVTCNTVPHHTNAIDVSHLIVEALEEEWNESSDSSGGDHQ